ncbi:MAG: hypothetical protein AAF442_06460 [Pseudomonadota bacterium]
MSLTRKQLSKNLSQSLRQYIGRGRTYSIDEFAQRTDIPQRTLSSWIQRLSTPRLYGWLQCAEILPADFAQRTLEIIGLTGLHRTHGSVTSHELHVKAADLTALIARHLLDGKIDHIEQAQQVEPIRQLHEATGAWLARQQK